MSDEMSDELKEDLRNFGETLLISPFFYDCTFKIGKKDNCKQFTALKAHLAHISDVFKGQLFGNFKEASQDRDTPIILLQCDPDAFECILRASYGLNPNIKESNVMALFEQSKFYQIPMLLKECTKWLQNNLNANNVLTILNTGYLLGLIDITNENTNTIIIANNEDNDSDHKEDDHAIKNNDSDSDSDSKDDTKDDSKNDTDEDTVVVSGSVNGKNYAKKAIGTSGAINTNIVTKIKNNGEIHDLSSLAIKCLSIICGNPDVVLKNDYFWQELHINVIIYIISNDYFNVNEEKLWDILSKWAQTQSKKIFNKVIKDNIGNDEKDGIDHDISESESTQDKKNTHVLEPPLSQVPTTYQVATSFASVRYNNNNNNKNSNNENNNADKPLTHCRTSSISKNSNNSDNNNRDNKCLYCEKMSCKLAGSLELQLMQPLIKYIHFTLMSPKYFANNVENWLLRDDLVFVYKRLCCNEFIDNDKDWVNHNQRISFDPNSIELKTYQSESLRKFFDNGYKYKLIAATCELNKAKYLCYDESKKPVETWSNVSMKECNDQWFIIKLSISNRVIKHISSIGNNYGMNKDGTNTTLQFQWKNKEASDNTPKNVQLFNCECESTTLNASVEKLGDSDWNLITEWQSQQTADTQTFTVDVEKLKSPFVKIKIVDLYGGEDNFPLLQDLKVLPNW